MTLLHQETGNKLKLIFEECFIKDFETSKSTLVCFETSKENIFAVFNSQNFELIAISIFNDSIENNWENLSFEKIFRINQIDFKLNDNFLEESLSKKNGTFSKTSNFSIPEILINLNVQSSKFELFVFKNKFKHCFILKKSNIVQLINEFNISNLDEMLFYLTSIINSEKIKNEDVNINLLYNAWNNLEDLQEFLLDYFNQVNIPEFENFKVNPSFLHYSRQLFLMKQLI